MFLTFDNKDFQIYNAASSMTRPFARFFASSWLATILNLLLFIGYHIFHMRQHGFWQPGFMQWNSSDIIQLIIIIIYVKKAPNYEVRVQYTFSFQPDPIHELHKMKSNQIIPKPALVLRLYWLLKKVGSTMSDKIIFRTFLLHNCYIDKAVNKCKWLFTSSVRLTFQTAT